MEKKPKYILIGIVGALSISLLVLTSLGIFNNSNDTNSGITGRTDALKEVHNITLEVEYVTQPTDIWENFSLFNFKTTVFDALDAKCVVQTSTFGLGILVIGINGVTGDWIYYVNGKFAGVAANAFNLNNGDHIFQSVSVRVIYFALVEHF